MGIWWKTSGPARALHPARSSRFAVRARGAVRLASPGDRLLLRASRRVSRLVILEDPQKPYIFEILWPWRNPLREDEVVQSRKVHVNSRQRNRLPPSPQCVEV